MKFSLFENEINKKNNRILNKKTYLFGTYILKQLYFTVPVHCIIANTHYKYDIVLFTMLWSTIYIVKVFLSRLYLICGPYLPSGTRAGQIKPFLFGLRQHFNQVTPVLNYLTGLRICKLWPF